MSDKQYMLLMYMLWLIMLNTSEKGTWSFWLSIAICAFIALAHVVVLWRERSGK